MGSSIIILQGTRERGDLTNPKASKEDEKNKVLRIKKSFKKGTSHYPKE